MSGEPHVRIDRGSLAKSRDTHKMGDEAKGPAPDAPCPFRASGLPHRTPVIGRLAVPSLGPRERQIEDHRSTTAAVRLERNSLTLGTFATLRANPSACRQGRCPPTEPPGAGHPRPRPQLATTSSLCSPGSGRRPAPTAHPACGNGLPATLTPTGPTGGARSVPGSWARDGPGLARRDRARPRPALPRRTPGRRMRRRRGR